MAVITIDTELCLGCRRCVVICPEVVLDLQDDHHAIVSRLEKCTLCQICEEGCPEGAIEVS